MADQVCLLLLLLWVDNQGTWCHRAHVAVLSAAIYIDCLRLKFVVIWVDLEFVHVKVATGVDQDGKREVKKASIHPFILEEVWHCGSVVEDGLDALLDGGVFNLFVALNNFFDFLHNFAKGKFCEFTGQT